MSLLLKQFEEGIRLPSLKISLDGEKELVDENAFEGGYIVLLIEHQHCLFVVNRIYSAE